MGQIVINDEISIDEDELQFEFVRSGGPGGQNVNKVSSSVQLRFDVAGTVSLNQGVKARLMRIAGKRVNDEGVLVIHARRYRSQEQNRQDALQRLVDLVQRASRERPPRIRTMPSAASRLRRLAAKRRKSIIKQQRGKVTWEH
jgi:ribosome-associated protein